MSCHKDTCIRFEIEENGVVQKFEAVGFMHDWESVCSQSDAFRRADNGHCVTTDEDWILLHGNQAQFPAELCKYYPVTRRIDPDRTLCLSGFLAKGHVWTAHLYSRYEWWDQNYLIVRRSVS